MCDVRVCPADLSKCRADSDPGRTPSLIASSQHIYRNGCNNSSYYRNVVSSYGFQSTVKYKIVCVFFPHFPTKTHPHDKHQNAPNAENYNNIFFSRIFRVSRLIVYSLVLTYAHLYNTLRGHYQPFCAVHKQ